LRHGCKGGESPFGGPLVASPRRIRKIREEESGVGRLAGFTALANSSRREVLQHLAKGEATVSEVRGLFQVSHAAVTNLLNMLDRGADSPALECKDVFPCKPIPHAKLAVIPNASHFALSSEQDYTAFSIRGIY